MTRGPLTLTAAALLWSGVALAGDPDNRPVGEVGKPAAEFSLTDQDGKKHTLSQYKGSVVVLEWTNPGCPFVKRHYKARTMATTQEKLGKKVVWLAVNSTHDNTAEASKKWAEEHKLGYVTLQDGDGTVGRSYGARTTPHMFVIDGKGILRYAGAIDDDPSGKAATARNYVDEAVTALLAGKLPAVASTDPYGCSVKYRK